MFSERAEPKLELPLVSLFHHTTSQTSIKSLSCTLGFEILERTNITQEMVGFCCCFVVILFNCQKCSRGVELLCRANWDMPEEMFATGFHLRLNWKQN